MDAKEHAVAMNYSSVNFSVFRSSVWFLVEIASVLSFFPLSITNYSALLDSLLFSSYRKVNIVHFR